MKYKSLGASLRKCRNSIKPAYTQRALAECIFSHPQYQGIFQAHGQSPDDLERGIHELETSGLWTLPSSILDPFLRACIECLDAICQNKKLLIVLGCDMIDIVGYTQPQIDFIQGHLGNRADPLANEEDEEYEEYEEDKEGED